MTDAEFRSRVNERSLLWNRQNKDKKNENEREYHRHLRMEVILAYGAKCVCCGEENFYFLTLDHVNNDGVDHRRVIGSSMYLWAKINNYPDTLQVLCYNCNLAKQNSGFGYCPHEESK